ncbi:MAG: flagellar basal body P-ring protein FlgI [Phycisphaerales bacterium]|nr:flagellar basal body P-ring protein FlgI [Phycisphaerales bacterium]
MPTECRNLSAFLIVTITATLGLPAGCGGSSRPPPQARVVPIVSRDVPAPLRGTIGAEASFQGLEPFLATGYGLVVGLNGTGGSDVPAPIRAQMERDMARMGVGKEVSSLRNLTPEEMLADKGVAIVFVQALATPGAPAGTRFDIVVSAIPGSGVTSLEGGRLWTTPLRRGVPIPGGPATEPIAEASGPIFVNPFIVPGDAAALAAAGSRGPAGKPARARPSADDDRQVGRILNGGVVKSEMRPVVRLDNPSHTRAKAITDAINTRFPRGTNPRPTARGMNEDTIEISVPREYQNRLDEFVQVLLHTRVEQGFAADFAVRYADALKEYPELAAPISWCIEALGEAAVPSIRRLYNYSEVVPRLAALRAGARLGDITTRPYLEEVVRSGTAAQKSEALGLMGRLGSDPAINRFLREKIDDPDVQVRIAAYEALDRRADPAIVRSKPGGKFLLHAVDAAEPMLFMTQQGEPKIVVFGRQTQVSRPVFANVWGGKFMLSADSARSKVRVYFRDTDAVPPREVEIGPDVLELLQFMAARSTPDTPEPGLDMTYAEIVGALYKLVQAGAVNASFVPEDDRLALELIRANQKNQEPERPELADKPLDEPGASGTGVAGATGATGPQPVEEVATPARTAREPAERAPDPERDQRRQRYVVPIPPRPPK